MSASRLVWNSKPRVHTLAGLSVLYWSYAVLLDGETTGTPRGFEFPLGIIRPTQAELDSIADQIQATVAPGP